MATEIKKKEFWEMTRAGVSLSLDIPVESVVASVLKTHEQAVRQAVKEGKPVPENVLRDYPDLLDKSPESGIMTSRGEKNDDRDDIQPSRIGKQSSGFSQAKQEERIQEDVSVSKRGVSQVESPSRQEASRESDRDRGERGGSLESSNPATNTGELQRLTPSDIVLTKQSPIGHDSGAATRFDANLAALRALKAIEDEHRQATPEEQIILAKYSGFGDSAFGEAFPRYEDRNFKNTSWGRRREELKALTSEEEFQSIERSRLNAFYTTPEVINAMWKALVKVGVGTLKNPRILEPSAGSGRFLGYQPEDMASKSERVAVELDSLTGRMLKQMYPKTETYIMGFEKAPIPKDSIDVAISNVPFGNYPIFDPTFKKSRKALTRSIHNYFFAKTLEDLRPGGVLAFITSHETLDAPTAKPIRQALADQADLLAAIRLPNNAFPDAKVVTDIVFMRKRMLEDKAGDQSWVNTTPQTFKVKSSWRDYDVTEDVNNYFIQHPEMVLGIPEIGEHGMRGSDEYTVMPKPNVSLASQLERAVESMPSNVITEAPRRELSRRIYTPTGSDVREYSRIVGEDGRIYIKRSGVLESANLTELEEAKIKGMLAVRDAAKAVVDSQVRDDGDDKLKALQENLRNEYQKYVLSHGALNNPDNTSLLDKDPDMPFLKALERNEVFKVNKDKLTLDQTYLLKVLTGKVKPTEADIPKLQMPIFNQRVIHGLGEKPVTDYADAESVVKNETGRLDFQVMADKLGKTEDEVIKALSDRRLIYKNPMGDWEPADQYLTGDVRNKLRQAEAVASAKPGFNVNVEALKVIIPADVPAGQISVRMGAPWIPATDINDFVANILQSRVGWRQRNKEQYFQYNEVTGKWQLINKPDVSSYQQREEYGTSRMSATQIIDHILNGKLVQVNDQIEGPDGKKQSVRNPQETIAAQEKAKAIQDKFREWIWSDSERTQRLVKDYNDKFNNYRPRFFDGQHQMLPGISEKWYKSLHPHQKDAIWRVVQDRTALLAHEVGFGKTAVMVVSGMELRRLGLSSKNLYVVPKATHGQFRDQFLDIYPYAKVLFPAEEDFTPAKRAEFMSRAITGDWDAIIVSDSQFRKVPVKPETEQRFLMEEINTMREALDAAEDKKTQKEIQKTLQRVLVRMENVQAKLKEKDDRTIYFEDIGVDQMYVDEADAYKNLKFVTQMGRIKGLPNSESERAWDMYQKTRTLQEQPHNGVVFATGTPVANTIAEMYTMMRYLQEPMLEEKGLKHFDAWAKTFGETTESLEQTPTGAYKLTQRFAKFANAPELSNMWQTTADIRVADEVPEMVKQRPQIVDEKGRHRRTVIATPPDQALLDYMGKLAKRADELKHKDPHEDNMLKISSDARKASLDMRLVEADAPVNPNGKVSLASKKIAEIYGYTTKDKGTQLVFLDMGTPKAKERVEDTEEIKLDGEDVEDTAEEQRLLTDVYKNLKAQLIADGVNEKDIAFIHDAKNERQKLALFEKVNNGDIRVLIGSTGKLGTGVNVQERAAALHHLDAPWRPRDIEQREGRIIRQGNKAYGPRRDATGKIIDSGQGVRVYTYVTERSFDAYMWQAIEAKSKAIKAIMRRSVPPRTIEDIDSFTMSASEAKALASGNPDLLKSVSLKNSVTRLQMLKASHTDAKIRANSQLQALPNQIKELQHNISSLEKDAGRLNKDAKFNMSVQGMIFTERPNAGEALVKAIKGTKDAGNIAEYNGFKVKVMDLGPQTGYKLVIEHPETRYTYSTTAIPYADLTGAGVIARIENRLKSLPGELEKAQRQLKENELNLTTYTKQADAPFEHEQQLTQMGTELDRLESKLQGQDVGESSSDNYVPEQEEEEIDPSYRWGARSEEQVNAQAEIKAVEAEIAPVEKTTEVKLPPANIEQTIEKIAEPRESKIKITTPFTTKDDIPGGVIMATESKVTGEQIAQALGVKFDGVQEGLGMQFTDPQTGSTTYGNTIEEVKGKLADLRGKFAEPEKPGPVTPEVTVEGKLSSKYGLWDSYTDLGAAIGEANKLRKLGWQVRTTEAETPTGKRFRVWTTTKRRKIEGHLPYEEAISKAEVVTPTASAVKIPQAEAVERQPTLGVLSKDKKQRLLESAKRRQSKRETRPLKKLTKAPSLLALRLAESMRTPRARGIDESRQHSKVITPASPLVRRWMNDQATADIQGIDTINLSRRAESISPRKARISKSKGRITPPRPKLRR